MLVDSGFSVQQLLLFLPLLPLVGAVVGGLLHFHRLPLGLRYLVGVASWALLIEGVARVLWLRRLPNLFLVPIDAVGELTLLVLVYRQVLRSAAFDRWVPPALGLFVIYALLRGLTAGTVVRFEPSLQVAEQVGMLLLVSAYFRKLLSELSVPALERDPLFWVSTGWFIYALGSVQIALFSNYLLQYSKQLNTGVWSVQALLATVLYSCYAVALWMRPMR